MAAVDDATNQLFDKIDKGEMKLTPKEAKMVQDAVNVHLAKTSTREEIRKELAALGETLVGIEKDFDNIRYEVQKISKLGILRDGDTYAARWIELHDEYTKLMAMSQKTANEAHSECEKLLKSVIPIAVGDEDEAAKRKAIQSYIKNLEKFNKGAEENAKRFLRLQQAVDAFRKRLKAAVVNQLSEGAERLKEIDKQIKGLQAQLEVTASFFAGAWEVLALSAPQMSRDATVSLSVGTAVGGVVASAGLAALAPVVGVGMLVAGFAALGYSIASGLGRRLSSRKEKEKEIDRLKEEEELLANDRKELETSLKQLLTLDTTFDRLAGRLGALQGIWRMLITDAQRLAYSLKDIDEEEDDLLTKTMAGNLEPTYRALMDALDQYSLATIKFKPKD